MNASQPWSAAPTSTYLRGGHAELPSVRANLCLRVAPYEQPTAADWCLHGVTATRITREVSRTDIHEWFGTSSVRYLFVERSLLQSMPLDWQHRLAGMLVELEEACPNVARADVSAVHAAEEREVAELTPKERAAAGMDREWEPTEDPEGGRWLYFVDGTELEPTDRVLVPVAGPVPRYDHRHITSAEEAEGAQDMLSEPIRPGLYTNLELRDSRYAGTAL